MIVVVINGCSSPKEEWNDDIGTYTNEKYGLSLKLPAENWQIAIGNDLPDKILLCGVIPEKEICTILCEFDEPICSEDIWSDNWNAVLSIIEQITKQETREDAIYSVPQIEKADVRGFKVIKFSRNLCIPVDGADTISAAFNGILTISKSKFIGLLNTFPGKENGYCEISEIILSGLNLHINN